MQYCDEVVGVLLDPQPDPFGLRRRGEVPTEPAARRPSAVNEAGDRLCRVEQGDRLGSYLDAADRYEPSEVVGICVAWARSAATLAS